MEKPRITQSSSVYEDPPHTMTAWYAGTQYTIRIPLDALVGSDFHVLYTAYLTQLHEINGKGLPIHFPFRVLEALEDLVWTKCRLVLEAHATGGIPERSSLQDLIQPLTVHLTMARSTSNDDIVVEKIVGDESNSETWATSRVAHRNSNITNSYGWGTAPVPLGYMHRDLHISTMMQHFKAAGLFTTRKANMAAQMQQVHTTAGEQFFFKPRLDIMAPEFDREISVLSAIVGLGSHRTLKVSPFRGLVLLENGLVAGMLFDWLEGSPLAEHPSLHDNSLHKIWRDQVEATVNELHKHNIIWGDVNVHNIFVDANADAWVVDFGGNCNVQFVDEALKETYEGDRQGLRRIFEEWLPSRAQAGK